MRGRMGRGGFNPNGVPENEMYDRERPNYDLRNAERDQRRGERRGRGGRGERLGRGGRGGFDFEQPNQERE